MQKSNITQSGENEQVGAGILISARFDKATVMALIDACDFIISKGYVESEQLIPARKELAILIGAPELMLCSHCGHDRDVAESQPGNSCTKCGEGIYQIA